MFIGSFSFYFSPFFLGVVTFSNLSICWSTSLSWAWLHAAFHLFYSNQYDLIFTGFFHFCIPSSTHDATDTKSRHTHKALVIASCTVGRSLSTCKSIHRTSIPPPLNNNTLHYKQYVCPTFVRTYLNMQQLWSFQNYSGTHKKYCQWQLFRS